jgi:hypothetical protein
VPKKIALEMANSPKPRSLQDPIPWSPIELPFLKQCAPLCRKPFTITPYFKTNCSNRYELDRMVRVESFTTLAKLGQGKEESFTSVLISRVCLVKTLKTLKLPEHEDTSENDHQHNEGM